MHECDAEIEKSLAILSLNRAVPEKPLPKARHKTKQPNALNFDVRQALYALVGVDLTQIHGVGPYLGLRLVSECGTDLSKWPTAKHFTSWLTLCPGSKITGGKVLSSHMRKSNNRIVAHLRLAATTLGRTNTALGAFYRRLSARIGKAKAVTATARKIAILFDNAMRHSIPPRSSRKTAPINWRHLARSPIFTPGKSGIIGSMSAHSRSLMVARAMLIALPETVRFYHRDASGTNVNRV